MNAIMKAILLLRSKDVLSDGSILEMIVWRVPVPVVGSGHSFKFRLYYGRGGVREVNFENERGKGDHCHIDGIETAYKFVDVDTLVADFLAAVRERRKRS